MNFTKLNIDTVEFSFSLHASFPPSQVNYTLLLYSHNWKCVTLDGWFNFPNLALPICNMRKMQFHIRRLTYRLNKIKNINVFRHSLPDNKHQMKVICSRVLKISPQEQCKAIVSISNTVATIFLWKNQQCPVKVVWVSWHLSGKQRCQSEILKLEAEFPTLITTAEQMLC